MLGDMFPHFRHRLTDGNVVVEKLAMPPCFPLSEGRKLLRDGVEETDNDTNWSCFHVIAELVNGRSIRDTVMAVKLHLFPDGEEDRGDHENRGPVLQSVTTVDARI